MILYGTDHQTERFVQPRLRASQLITQAKDAFEIRAQGADDGSDFVLARERLGEERFRQVGGQSMRKETRALIGEMPYEKFESLSPDDSAHFVSILVSRAIEAIGWAQS